MEFKILKAAEELFVKQGFEKTTTGQIAKLAGCNQALVHYYYRTKDNLFDKIFEEKIRLMATNLLSLDLSGIAFEEKIAKLVETHFDFLMSNAEVLPFLFNELSSNPKRVHQLADKVRKYPNSIFTQIEDALQDGVKAGTLKPISSVDLIFTILPLNTTPFLMKPILKEALDISENEYLDIILKRKKEVVEMILSWIRI